MRRNEKERSLVLIAGWAAAMSLMIGQVLGTVSPGRTGAINSETKAFMLAIAPSFLVACGGLWVSYRALSYANSEDANDQREYAFQMRVAIAFLGLQLALVFITILFVGLGAPCADCAPAA